MYEVNDDLVLSISEGHLYTLCMASMEMKTFHNHNHKNRMKDVTGTGRMKRTLLATGTLYF